MALDSVSNFLGMLAQGGAGARPEMNPFLKDFVVPHEMSTFEEQGVINPKSVFNDFEGNPSIGRTNAPLHIKQKNGSMLSNEKAISNYLKRAGLKTTFQDLEAGAELSEDDLIKFDNAVYDAHQEDAARRFNKLAGDRGNFESLPENVRNVLTDLVIQSGGGSTSFLGPRTVEAVLNKDLEGLRKEIQFGNLNEEELKAQPGRVKRFNELSGLLEGAFDREEGDSTLPPEVNEVLNMLLEVSKPK